MASSTKRVSLKGRGAELFFGDYRPLDSAADAEAGESFESLTDAAETLSLTAAVEPEPELATPLPPAPASGIVSSPVRRTATPSPSRRKASELASAPADDGDLTEGIRQIVKSPGREVSFVRLSMAEKERLGDLVYAYKKRGHKVTETEIARIAVNYILADYDRGGEGSVLARVLASLRA